jgi:hypothetical protein
MFALNFLLIIIHSAALVEGLVRSGLILYLLQALLMSTSSQVSIVHKPILSLDFGKYSFDKRCF